ncbi:monooxygenase [Mycobacterium sp. E802]|uniref:FAD-dependent oxidoreductase n=1 Tax=Mycobacterium sp. E802 TaxID=1834152 RepID=UPI0007FD13AD|nr:FAD-dependent oxidoreductase [Mycobacterium sp. E802]OBG89795.1 monooxygenase [Mycobacterium sp. E802]
MSTVRPRIAIAGSGLAGLHCAVNLASSAEVTVYERLPVPGGEHWEDGEHHALVRQARRGGVRFAAGTQVVRWEGDRLLAVGEGGGIAAADALVVATGHRPPTRAELRIDGNRCAGVVPATLALHLLQQQVDLGHHVVVVGDSDWAAECIALMTAQQDHASIVWVGAAARPAHPSVTLLPDARVTATHGMPRITGVTVESAPAVEQVVCDCLILAGPAVAYRNIDGAVLDDEPAVFAQRHPETTDSSARIGLLAARHALAVGRAAPHTHIPVLPRIGLPR